MTLFLALGSEERTVRDGESLTFGRDADWVVDADNRYLHRVLGCFVDHAGVWFLQNLGRFVTLWIDDADSTSRVEVASGEQSPVAFRDFTVWFTAGPDEYRISGSLSEPTPLQLGPAAVSDTEEFGLGVLNQEQRALVLVLAEGRLRGDPEWERHLPTNREVAHRLGWSITKFNRKLDYLCRRLAEAGVGGVAGDAADLAVHRRQVLVEHVVTRRLVVPGDLDDLPPRRTDEDPPDAPVP